MKENKRIKGMIKEKILRNRTDYEQIQNLKEHNLNFVYVLVVVIYTSSYSNPIMTFFLINRIYKKSNYVKKKQRIN